MSHTDRITFILHGRHCPNGLPEHLLAPFRDHFDIDIMLTTTADSATRFAREATLAGTRWLIAVGGDGTVHEVINGMMSVPAEARQHTVLGVLPSGTGNDFFRSLNSSADISQLPAMMAAGHYHPTDLIRVESSDGTLRWCNNIASIGISSDIVRRVKRLPAWLPASVSFNLAVISALLRYKPEAMQLTLDGEEISGEFLCVSVANGRFFGSGLGIAPHASLDDGLFELIMISRASSLDFVRLLPQLRQAKQLDDPRIRYLRGRELGISGIGRQCALELDGELCGETPVSFRIERAAIQCLRQP